MTLSEIYFYIIIIICMLYNFIIITSTEDLKKKKYFNQYLQIASIFTFFGLLMEIFGWTFFCKFNCLLLMSSPLIIILMIKIIMYYFKNIYKKEGFQLHRNKLSDGIFEENKGDLKQKRFYQFYTFIIMAFPSFTIVFLFSVIKNSFCY